MNTNDYPVPLSPGALNFQGRKTTELWEMFV